MAMDASDPFAIDDDIAIWRPHAALSLERATELVRKAIDHARKRGFRKLLADISRLHGFESASIPTRHQLARRWAKAAGGTVRVAFVAKAEVIDPEKFGVIAGRNFGAETNVFTNEADARAWLRGD